VTQTATPAPAPGLGETEKPFLSFVVPCYKSELSLPLLHQRISACMAAARLSFELILVEDCGGDGTWPVIQALRAEDGRVRGVRLSRNFGQHNALLAGIRRARGEWIVTLDDDLQNPPEAVADLLAKAREGYDVVYAAPPQLSHGLARNLASRITKLVLQKAMGADVAVHTSAYRLFRTRLRDAFADVSGPTVSIDVLLTWGTTSYAWIPVPQHERTLGQSGYTWRKLITHALNMMTGFSVLPLQLATLLGFAFAVFGVLVLTYVVARVLLFGSPVPGFPFLASLISLFAGIQLFALGIIGEYLARMHLRSMQRPAYVVAEECGGS
jgi:glycosyltransferase involved in cell wall biosynthesis